MEAKSYAEGLEGGRPSTATRRTSRPVLPPQRLPKGQQALPVLAHLRCGHVGTQLAAGFDVGATKAYRYGAEAGEILAPRAGSGRCWPDSGPARRSRSLKGRFNRLYRHRLTLLLQQT